MSDELETMRSIVRDLAAKEPRAVVYNGGYYDRCALCGAHDLDAVIKFLDETDPKDYDKRPTFPLAHAEACPWRRAVEAQA